MSADTAQRFLPQSRGRALAYRALLGSARYLYKAGNGLLFAAAGLLRQTELQAASIDQNRFFNLSAFEVDAGLSPCEQHFYQKFLRDKDRVLLVGCGSGRDLIALQSLGYDVTGLEPIPELVDLARQHLARRGMSAPVHAGLIQSAELGGPYDAVIFSNGCYSCLQGTQVRVASLARVSRQLSKQGRVIFSYRPAARQSRLGRWLTRATARIVGADWWPEPGDTFTHDLHVPELVRYHRSFEPDELAKECAAAGLMVVADELSDEGFRFAAATVGRA